MGNVSGEYGRYITRIWEMYTEKMGNIYIYRERERERDQYRN